MFKQVIAAAAIAAAFVPAHAVTVTQWNFNSVVPDANTATGNAAPSTGSGTLAAVGGTTTSFASGDASGGSSDPATGDDSGLGLTTFPVQGTANKTAGVQFNVSTVGFTGVVISFDQRPSNTAAASTQLQYTVNGTTFIDAAGGLFTATAGDTWFNGRTVNLTGVAGVDNNASFGIRLVAALDPGTSTYVPATSTSSYGTTGTYRFDMVTFTAAAVPEPGTYALLLAGLGAVGFIARRRA